MLDVKPLTAWLAADESKIAAALDSLPQHVLPFGYSRFIKKERCVLAASKLMRECLGQEKSQVLLALEDEDLRGILAYRFLPWDTEHFGIPMGRIEFLRAFAPGDAVKSVEIQAVLLEALSNTIRLQGTQYVYGRFTTGDVRSIHALIEGKYALMETLCVYALAAKDADFSTVRGKVPVRPSIDSDVPILSKIAGESFVEHDRFHLDQRIPKVKSDELMSIWVEKSHEGKFDDFLLTALRDSEPVGFMTGKRYDWELLGYPLSHLSFSAVDPKGTGAYVSLVVGGAEKLFKDGAKQIDLNTQIQNLKVIKVWEYLGFNLVDSLYTFRRWFY